jgi:cell wall assembly regulator SMI1
MDSFKTFVDFFNKSDENQPFQANEIERLESEFQINLPEDYKSFVEKYGNVYTPEILDIIDDNELDLSDVQQFFTAEEIINDKRNGWTSKIETDLIPFASDCMGNIYAFKTSEIKGKNNKSSVYLFDHDFDSVDLAADSFKKFIEGYNKIIK